MLYREKKRWADVKGWSTIRESHSTHAELLHFRQAFFNSEKGQRMLAERGAEQGAKKQITAVKAI